MTTISGTDAYLGIDMGTQGLSVMLTDQHLKVLATGEATYGFVAGVDEGCYEQRTEDWWAALETAMGQARTRLGASVNVLAVGISGQMHGEVLCDASGACLSPVRLWCDSRNGAEGEELTGAFGVKVPRRATASRFLWTARNRPELAQRVQHLTTPAGWLAYRLTGEFNIGIGDASGMFPIDECALDFNEKFLQMYDSIVNDSKIPSLKSILPKVRCAGQDAGRLQAAAAKLLGLPEGIPVAPCEGDQLASLAGGLVGDPGMVSCSFGISVCANTIGDRAFQGVSPIVDQFNAADGKPMLMVCLINGTTFLNAMVGSYTAAMKEEEKGTAFATLMRHVVDAPDDCGGILALPFLDDEPCLGVSQGNNGSIFGLNHTNATPGNICKAALLCVMFNLRMGQQVLDDQGYERQELNLAGGLCKTPESGQILANVFNRPVVLSDSADEGCCWGACVLAKFRHDSDAKDWPSFLRAIAETLPKRRFEPNEESVKILDGMLEKYKKLMAMQASIGQAMSGRP